MALPHVEVGGYAPTDIQPFKLFEHACTIFAEHAKGTELQLATQYCRNYRKLMQQKKTRHSL